MPSAPFLPRCQQGGEQRQGKELAGHGGRGGGLLLVGVGSVRGDVIPDCELHPASPPASATIQQALQRAWLSVASRGRGGK